MASKSPRQRKVASLAEKIAGLADRADNIIGH